MKIFKKPEDKYTEEEYNEMRKELQDLNLSKKEEWQMIWAAIKTIFPWVLLAIVGAWSLVIIFWLIVVR